MTSGELVILGFNAVVGLQGEMLSSALLSLMSSQVYDQ